MAKKKKEKTEKAKPDNSNVTPKMLVAGLRAKYGPEAAMLMGETGTGVKGVCPTGLAVLDRYVLGIGGLPYGRTIEVFGMESSGKTTLADRILAGVQRDGGIAALVETEQSYDPQWAKLHGVDVDNLILAQPNYLDGDGGVLQQIESLVTRSSKSRPIAVVLDSVAATPTKREFDEGITGDVAVAEAARAWSTGLRTLNQVVSRHNALLILVNQTRSKIGVMFGNPETTPGGNAIKFYSSIRLSCFPGKKVEGYDGRHFYVTAVKNKLCPPYRKAIMRMSYTDGFDEMWNIINYAKDVGCIEKSAKVNRASLVEACKNLSWPEPPMVEGSTESETDEEDQPEMAAEGSE
jgi:recombination protein RecA